MLSLNVLHLDFKCTYLHWFQGDNKARSLDTVVSGLSSLHVPRAYGCVGVWCLLATDPGTLMTMGVGCVHVCM